MYHAGCGVRVTPAKSVRTELGRSTTKIYPKKNAGVSLILALRPRAAASIRLFDVGRDKRVVPDAENRCVAFFKLADTHGILA